MSNKILILAAFLSAYLVAAPWALAQASSQPAVVSNIKVLSDKVPDVSSLEAWKAWCIKDGMSDKDKAMAIFKAEVMFQVADAPPPMEFLHREKDTLDVMKIWNVYGYTYCSVSAANVTTLARYSGLKARNFTIQNHVVPELFHDGAWHMYDADLIEYFPKADGSIASCEELAAGIQAWAKDHPDFPGFTLKEKKERYKWMASHKWKTEGPEILSRNPYYDGNGWLPDGSFAWGDQMQQFSKIGNNWQSNYSMGYQVNIQLRPGEKLTRNWSNKGLYINKGGNKDPGSLTGKIGEKNFKYMLQWGDLAPGRIGNGTLEYDVPLATGEFVGSALKADNLATKADDKAGPAVHVKDAANPGVLDIRMPCSYVYLTGELAFMPALGDGGEIKVLLSDNNGLDWKDVTTVNAAGDQKVDISKFVLRRYNYIVRFVMKGKGTGLETLKITNDIQNSQRVLPALGQGDNKITFSSAAQEGTISIEGCSDLKNAADKQLVWTDFHPVVDGCTGDSPKWDGKDGSIIYTVKTPGDISRLRVFDYFTSGSKSGKLLVDVSFDDGKTWKKVDEPTAEDMDQPRIFVAHYNTVSEVPAGTRAAKVKYYTKDNKDTIFLTVARIDADYKEPAGGFRPVNVTYVWEEGGIEKKDVHKAEKADDTWTIKCETKPVMKSITLELAK